MAFQMDVQMDGQMDRGYNNIPTFSSKRVGIITERLTTLPLILMQFKITNICLVHIV